jgi:hypothetical protein
MSRHGGRRRVNTLRTTAAKGRPSTRTGCASVAGISRDAHACSTTAAASQAPPASHKRLPISWVSSPGSPGSPLSTPTRSPSRWPPRQSGSHPRRTLGLGRTATTDPQTPPQLRVPPSRNAALGSAGRRRRALGGGGRLFRGSCSRRRPPVRRRGGKPKAQPQCPQQTARRPRRRRCHTPARPR